MHQFAANLREALSEALPQHFANASLVSTDEKPTRVLYDLRVPAISQAAAPSIDDIGGFLETLTKEKVASNGHLARTDAQGILYRTWHISFEDGPSLAMELTGKEGEFWIVVQHARSVPAGETGEKTFTAP